MDARSWLQKTHTSIRFVYAREHTGYMLYLNHTFVSSLHPPVSWSCQKHRVHKGVLKKLEHAAHTHTHISLLYGFIISFCELSHTFYGLLPDTACHLLTGQNLLADHLPAFVFHNILYDICEKDEYSTVYTFAFCCGGLHSIWQSVNWLLCVSNWRQEAWRSSRSKWWHVSMCDKGHRASVGNQTPVASVQLNVDFQIFLPRQGVIFSYIRTLKHQMR